MRRGLAFAVVLFAITPATALAGTFTSADVTVPMDDGASIATTVFTPDGAAPAAGWPIVVLAHGLGGKRADMTPIAQVLAADGYVALTFDARGHGQSTGLTAIDSEREVQDLRALLAFVKARPATDDAHVGALGISLGGGLVWRAAVEGLGFQAIVPVITWTNLAYALFPYDLSKSGVIAGFLNGLPPDRTAPEINAIRQQALTSENIQSLIALAVERSVSPKIRDRSFRVPTFLIHGRRDFVFDLEEARWTYDRLSGPKRLYLGDLGHPPAANPAAEQPYYVNEAKLWFDRFLKGTPNGIDRRPPIEIAHDPWDGKTTQLKTLPATRMLTFHPAGRRATIGDQGKLQYTFRLSGRVETFGTGTVAVDASTTGAWHHLVAVVSALTPAGKEIVVTSGGAPTQILGAKSRRVVIHLLSQVTAIPAGSRLRVTLAGASTAQSPDNAVYLLGVPAGSRVTLGDVTVRLPVLRTPISR